MLKRTFSDAKRNDPFASFALDYIGGILAGGFQDPVADCEADNQCHCSKYCGVDPPTYGGLALELLLPYFDYRISCHECRYRRHYEQDSVITYKYGEYVPDPCAVHLAHSNLSSLLLA